jgi:hypothetical protein
LAAFNLAWPDWEEGRPALSRGSQNAGPSDLIPAISLSTSTIPRWKRLVKMTSERGLILQVVFGMEIRECIIPLSTSARHLCSLVAGGRDHAQREGSVAPF